MHGQLGVLNEASPDVVGASDNPKQARIGCDLVIGILDEHSHFATNPFEACRHPQCHDVIGLTSNL
jgi:hypothetical protein